MLSRQNGQPDQDIEALASGKIETDTAEQAPSGSDWKQTARELFFEGGCSVVQIAAYTGVSRQSIAAHLKGCDGYAGERDRRKAASAASRKEYKKAKNREYRAAGMEVTAETMRREHDTAALILSRERYHN